MNVETFMKFTGLFMQKTIETIFFIFDLVIFSQVNNK